MYVCLCVCVCVWKSVGKFPHHNLMSQYQHTWILFFNKKKLVDCVLITNYAHKCQGRCYTVCCAAVELTAAQTRARYAVMCCIVRCTTSTCLSSISVVKISHTRWCTVLHARHFSSTYWPAWRDVLRLLKFWPSWARQGLAKVCKYAIGGRISNRRGRRTLQPARAFLFHLSARVWSKLSLVDSLCWQVRSLTFWRELSRAELWQATFHFVLRLPWTANLRNLWAMWSKTWYFCQHKYDVHASN